MGQKKLDKQRKYVIVKSGRSYNSGIGYSGMSCIKTNIEPGKIYSSNKEALADANKLTMYNPIGFDAQEFIP